MKRKVYLPPIKSECSSAVHFLVGQFTAHIQFLRMDVSDCFNLYLPRAELHTVLDWLKRASQKEGTKWFQWHIRRVEKRGIVEIVVTRKGSEVMELVKKRDRRELEDDIGIKNEEPVPRLPWESEPFLKKEDSEEED